jgi:hypothetical protein
VGEWMPDGLGDPDLVAGLRERGSVANGTRRATRCRTSLGDPRSDVAVRSTGHERLPYLSRMCSFMASVVAHLTRVRPGAEGASDQDRLGPGRIRPSRRTAPAMCSAPPGRVGPVADVDQLAHAVRARSGRRRPEEAVVPSPVDLEPQAKAVVDANANPPYLF